MNPDYAFQGSLYRTEREMLDATAYEWLTAQGQNVPTDVTAILRDTTDEELAAECVRGWGLDERSGDTEPGETFEEDAETVEVPDSHMERNGYGIAALAAAFARFRASRPDVAGEKIGG